jgi:hypothetical protein
MQRNATLPSDNQPSGNLERPVETALLAVDLGVRTGFACFSNTPSLRWYQSANFGNAARMRKAIPAILGQWPDLAFLVIEGGGDLARPWVKEAGIRGLEVLIVSAGEWRKDVLYPRQQRSGIQAKQNALVLARRVIDQLGGNKPTTPLQDDVAEAILCGYWAIGKKAWVNPAVLP